MWISRLVCVLLATTGSLQAEVQWRDGTVGASASMTVGELSASLVELDGRASFRRVVVQLDGPVDPQARARLAAEGITLLDPLGGNTWFATLEDTLNPARAASSLKALRRVERIADAHKLHPDLAAGLVRPWSVVPGDDVPGDGQAETVVAAYVWFHRDVDIARQSGPLIARHRGKVRSRLKSIPAVVAHLPFNEIAQLAAEDEVMWVEPPLPPFDELNDSSRARVEAEPLQQAPYGLNGVGIHVMVYDGGQVYAHNDLAGRLTVGPGDTGSISYHASHVAGTIAGNGSESGGTYRGMAPAARIYSYSYEQGFQSGGTQAGFLYTDPGDMERDYAEAMDYFGVQVTNNSIGTNTAPNGFPCEWEGDYGATSALIDEIARGSLGSRPAIIWANGNERGGSQRCGAGYLTTAPPACAKNPIHVGALNSNNDSTTDFTSWGPCDDGRLKPTVSGPGCQIGDDDAVTSTGDGPGYIQLCGTSMASPAVAGLSALLVQQHRQTFPMRPDLDNATVKAILANSAVDVEEIGPDFKTGYGSVRGVAAVETIQQERFLTAEVGQGEVLRFLVTVPAPISELKVTLAWDDPAGNPNTTRALVNDLDLRVVDLGGSIYLPWTLDPSNPSAPAVKTQRDALNNIEQVSIPNAVTIYHVEVVGFDVAVGTTQRFSLAANAQIDDCTWAGRIDTDRFVTCDEYFKISVNDCHLDTDPSWAEQVPVEVWSTTDSNVEQVTLMETAISSPSFEGEVILGSQDGSGVVQVQDGDTVRVLYIDQNNGAGGFSEPVIRDVTVDCRPPNIVNLAAIFVDRHNAVIRASLNEPAALTIQYGLSCAMLDRRATDLGPSTSHQISINALPAGTTYYFAAEAVDEAGNWGADDNNGACYSFTTGALPVYLWEEFNGSASIDFAGSSFILTPDGSPGHYGVCQAPLAGQYPVDYSPGDTMFQVDLTSSFTAVKRVELPLGKEVMHFGQSQPRAWISADGYVTYDKQLFASSYGNLPQFLEAPMVALMWAPTESGSLGTIGARALPDRMAYTWDGVTLKNGQGPSRMQLETLFDGPIRLNYLEVDLSDPFLGVSEGTGPDPDLTGFDFSAVPLCDPCVDQDSDGFEDCRQLCDATGFTCGDCDDNDFNVSPVALEICNHRDDDCDGLIDEGFLLPPIFQNASDPAAGSNARAGIAVEALPDIDGDGFQEILVGAPDDDTEVAAGAGSAMVLSGATRSLICKAIDPLGDANDDLGRSITALSDVTGDGIADFAVGNPVDDDVAVNAGAVLVFSGADCSLVYRATNPLSHAGDFTGFSIDTIPDMTGDGFEEILVGAPFAHRLSDDVSVGAVLIFSGANGSYVDRAEDIQALSAGAQMGYSVAGSIRSFVGSTAADFLAGAPFHDSPGGQNVGLAQSFDGSDRSAWSSYVGVAPGELMGASVAVLDDADFDGWPTIAFGSPGANSGRGAISVRDVNTTSVYLSDSQSQDYDNFGWSIARYRDLDGDQTDEILVGSPFNDAAGTSAGRISVLNGATGVVMKRIEDPGVAAGGQFGFAVGMIGDLSGDGQSEILAGSPFFHGGGASTPGKASAISFETDCDLDGISPFAGDCDDSLSAIQSVPGEVTTVGFLDSTMMTWTQPTAGGAVIVSYDLLRSTDPSDFLGAICLDSNFSGTARTVTDSPSNGGDVYYYLLRAENYCGPGPLGTSSDGVLRHAPNCP